jgi:hypothetical protein
MAICSLARNYCSSGAIAGLVIRSAAETGKSCGLGLKVIDDPATRHVAEKIIELSQHGVRGVATLHAMTVKEFQGE